MSEDKTPPVTLATSDGEPVKKKIGRPRKYQSTPRTGRNAETKAGDYSGDNLPVKEVEGQLLVHLTPKRGRPPSKHARKAPNFMFKVTQETLETVERLATRGMTYQQIAYYLGISNPQLSIIRKEDELLNLYLERGKSKGIEAVSGMLFDKAMAGDTIAGIFYLKCIAGWRETTNVAISASMHVSFDKQDESA